MNDNLNEVPDYQIIRAMKRYGGGFVKALGEAASHADDQNLERIKHAFPDYWKAYAKFCQPENDEPTT